MEQTDGNVARFGPRTLHNRENIIPLDKSLHSRISGYYSSIQPFTRGKTGRDWLRPQSFVEQREFGLKMMRDLGGAP
ncbi:MAG: hypothetical protein EOO71_06735 [Myxococcaceae bacterium]|nr:MAG: hypothetical protein EOO71_06735 [Myxococcaceae bacterium]